MFYVVAQEEYYNDMRALASKNGNTIAQSLLDVIASIRALILDGEQRQFFSPIPWGHGPSGQAPDLKINKKK